MFTIQVLDNISPQGLSLFHPDLYQLGLNPIDPDVILVHSHKLHNHPFSKNLKAVARAGTGTDNIPVEELTKKGIPVFYAPGANTNAIKELVMAAMIMGYRHLDQTRTFITNLTKENNQLFHQEIETKKKKFIGHEISGKILGVIGLGNVGVKVANAAFALGMKVLGFDTNMTLNNALALMPGVEKVTDMNLLLTHADIITLHIPLNVETKHLINEQNIVLLKPNTLLLNFSREQVVSEPAILQQLNNNQLMGYITDFPTINLANHPNVLCFPHLGASTQEAEQSASEMIIRNICNYLEHGGIEYSVNFPNISLSTAQIPNCHRMLTINQNTPGVIGKITQKISKLKYNVEQMENKSRGPIAINLIDLSGPKESLPELCKQLKEISSLMHVRHITVHNKQ
ncbi:3-phosphoglycerate dehydrogenase family protein [Legionella longbeachae]|uniref:D-3-phosphoglycerate dehydrogenase n=1 Tax=Legionella longbeachae serogroup 1 (strain NSW150) TaxID=661367 RepID=D3HQ98_LEGLN|nr:3-phosphoglycerate dehydrogenase family protein [Legionella longbeachae]VEE01585.1 D-isomer specific 2-hydroxyacid dehydrogenase [Legionella oakridgensis]HBD7396346.1 3-phosphoglycerate dehydrogenase [Legionella pneumophila]ARB92069.1 3-phosphoglycerate dehydrogenase [Legionella longbeachae]ARM34750.1 3-phosphoglycerate dehydrogenase [Legionella longbeachae]EEZ95827.1 D-3-phosphoglycerate dehydrogenase [Legionella longbeachae D-4968]